MWPSTTKATDFPIAEPYPKHTLRNMEFWMFNEHNSTAVIKLPEVQIIMMEHKHMMRFREHDIKKLARTQILTPKDENFEVAAKEYTGFTAKIVKTRMWAGSFAPGEVRMWDGDFGVGDISMKQPLSSLFLGVLSVLNCIAYEIVVGPSSPTQSIPEESRDKGPSHSSPCEPYASKSNVIVNRGRIACTAALSNRGVPVMSTACTRCGSLEDVDHILVAYPFATKVRDQISRWISVPLPTFGDVKSFLEFAK
ncbi:hypothetical protein LXL04_020393 [Taraxacum kok-saghyz]